MAYTTQHLMAILWKPELVNSPLILMQGVLKLEGFTTQMPFLSPNQQRQSTDEG